MPEWLVERGIGETRTALVENGRIIEARIARDGVIQAGAILEAQLRSIGRNAIALAEGQEFLLPKGALGITEGASLTIEVTREAIGGAEAWKRPLARVADGLPRAAPGPDGRKLHFPSPTDELGDAGWADLLDEARTGLAGFPGGELRVSVTPAMTLIDIDGSLEPAELAVAGALAAATAIRRYDIGGSIGIDLPTAGSKAARHAAAAAVDGVLPQPFERTSVNGFGFLQVVRPRLRPSLFELAADRQAFEARALLRLAAKQVGAICLVAHPAVVSALEKQPDWIDELARQVGGTVTLRRDPSLAMSAGHATRV